MLCWGPRWEYKSQQTLVLSFLITSIFLVFCFLPLLMPNTFFYMWILGRTGDAGVFRDSSLKKALDTKTLRFPQNIEGTTTPICYHIGDDAFPLRKDIMKPYPHQNLDKPKRIFNYRLSRARLVTGNAFGILANRFRVFLTTIKLDPDKVVDIILAACCLHNFMVEQNTDNYISVQDFEDVEHFNFINGQWRNDPQLCGLQTSSS